MRICKNTYVGTKELKLHQADNAFNDVSSSRPVPLKKIRGESFCTIMVWTELQPRSSGLPIATDLLRLGAIKRPAKADRIWSEGFGSDGSRLQHRQDACGTAGQKLIEISWVDSSDVNQSCLWLLLQGFKSCPWDPTSAWFPVCVLGYTSPRQVHLRMTFIMHCAFCTRP